MLFAVKGLVFTIIYVCCWSWADLESLVGFGAQLLPVFGAVLHPINPFVQISLYALAGFADLVSFQVEGVIAVIIPLGVGWVGSVWDVANRVDDETGDQGAVRVGADDRFVDDLLGR